jgi:hypothetical protein
MEVSFAIPPLYNSVDYGLKIYVKFKWGYFIFVREI